jgi:hypothetical protein
MAFAANLGSSYQYGNNVILTNANNIVGVSYFFQFTPQSSNGLTLANGMIWSSNVHNALRTFQANTNHTLSSVIFVATGTTVANLTTAETSLIPTTGRGSANIPANYWTMGKVMRVTIEGLISAPSPKGGNISMSVYLGSTKIVNSTSVDILTSGMTNSNFTAVIRLLCTNNITSTVLGSGTIQYDTDSSFTLAPTLAGVTVNTAANSFVNVTATLVGGANLNIYSTIIEILG